MTAHGFRTTACSLLNESNEFRPNALERVFAFSELADHPVEGWASLLRCSDFFLEPLGDCDPVLTRKDHNCFSLSFERNTITLFDGRDADVGKTPLHTSSEL